MRLSSSVIRAVASLALCATGTAPALASTTITLTGTVWQFAQIGFKGSYQPSNLFGVHDGVIGSVGEPGLPGTGFDGEYAANVEFLIPDLPDDAIITSAVFAIVDGLYYGGDEQMWAYLVPDTEQLASRVGKGSLMATFHGAPPLPLDVTDLINFLEPEQAGSYLGFSFVQTANNCGNPGGTNCYNDIGGGVGTAAPEITITYDLPTPPASDVPEPASWMLMAGGFGIAGTAMRRRRKLTLSLLR